MIAYPRSSRLPATKLIATRIVSRGYIGVRSRPTYTLRFIERANVIRAAIILFCVLAIATPAPARAPRTKAAVQAEIWALEQTIYAARGRGDMRPYIDHVAHDYLAWPPRMPAPAGIDSLHALAGRMAADNREILTMTPVAFSLSGDAAVIYYSTHRTRHPDGSAADERFDVIHNWVYEGERWRLLGGMARAAHPAG